MTTVAFENDLKAAIRSIPDYPKPGIMFRDITTLLGDARAFRRAVDELVQPWAGGKIDKVAGIEARGFILGGAVAHQVSAGFALPPGGQYNKYFPTGAIGMPKPLSDGQVQYTDGTPMTVDQYGRDVSAFLMWAAEPTLDARKRLGFQVMIFLIVFSGLLYFTKKKVWYSVLHDPELEKPRAPTEYKS